MLLTFLIILMMAPQASWGLGCEKSLTSSNFTERVTRSDFEGRLEELAQRVEDPARGFFGPGSIVWKVWREQAVRAAGPAAIALQIAEPSIADSIARNPEGIRDPLRRYQVTRKVLEDIIFGDLEAATSTARHLHLVHAKYRGTTAENGAYHANNPQLMVWVWSTLIQTGMRAYESFVAEMSVEEKQSYYSEAKIMIALSGVPPEFLPKDYEAFNKYFSEKISNLKVNSQAREILDFLQSREGIGSVVEQKLGKIFVPFSRISYRQITAALLPETMAEAFGLETSPTYSYFFGQVRHAVAVAPVVMRYRQVYRAAVRRIQWNENY